MKNFFVKILQALGDIFSKSNLKKLAIFLAIAVVLAFIFACCVPASAWSPDCNFAKFFVWRNGILTILRWTILFVGIAFWKSWIRAIFLTLFFVPEAVLFYIAWVFKIPASYGLLVDIFETNPQEVASFMSFSAILAIILAGTIFSALAIFLGKFRFKFAFPRTKFVALILWIALIFALFASPKQFPFEYIKSFKKYDSEARQITKEILRANEAAEKIPVPAPKNSPTIFFHFGESVRADRTPFCGYERNTFPQMLKKFEAGEVVVFPNCTSFATSTRPSSVGILTKTSLGDAYFSGETFVPYFNAAGTPTIGFFSMFENGFHDSIIVSLTNSLRERHFSRELSDVVCPQICEKIAGTPENRPQFFFYYGEGSHVPGTNYNYEKFNVFTPVPSKNEIANDARRGNAYDNSLIATDDFCAKVTDALANRDAVYIYVADHGDCLGENGNWNRNLADKKSATEPYIRRVLCFVWASKKFRQNHPKKWANLQKNARDLPCISHDYIYHSVLGAAGIFPPNYVPALDFFSENAQTFPQEIPPSGDIVPETKKSKKSEK